jgi:predicted flap endonuclease-1-like 5' DNA nuclease
MVAFILQSLFLIAAAFIVGAILGSLFKRFSRKSDSISQSSTRAADARLASLSALGTPANDDVKRSAQAAAAMIPPAEPVPAMGASIQPSAKSAPKTAAKKAPAGTKSAPNPRQDDGNRPALLKAARRGKPDSLTAIEGIGNVIQSKLFALGVFHYDQIAAWNADEAAWVSEEIGFPGRALRENWGKQAVAMVKPAGGARAAKPKVAAKAAGKKVTRGS